MTKEEALAKMQHYCSYQDRCHQEVRTKLLSLKVYGDWLEEVMSQLINDNYLNEERYAQNYARGKFRIKGWGKMRITQELKRRYISEYCIRKAMSEIDEEGGYVETLEKHLCSYINQRKDKYNAALLRKNAYSHGIRKGFESELVAKAVASLF